MLDALTHQLNDPLGYAVPVFLIFILIEVLHLRGHKDEHTTGYDRKDSTASISMGVISVILGVGFRTVGLVLFVAIHVYLAPWHLPTDAWYTWVILFVGIDFLFYLYHRFAHRVRVAWAGHQVHHSSEYFNFGTALRQKWNQWYDVVMWIPLPLLGMSPWMIYTGFSVNLLYQFIVHTERVDRLPAAIEFVFNTPSHHRVHHGSDPEYLDKNYGGMFIIWDRMFGTFQQERQRPKYGLTHPVGTHNIAKLQFHEYGAMVRDVRSAKTVRDKLGYVFGPPGWRPAAERAVERAVEPQRVVEPQPQRERVVADA